MEDVNHEHEILNIDDAFKNKKTQDKPIKCNDIFTELRKNNEKKTVLTKGVAGIGKTVSVHKFILDWAEGKANQDIHCVFLFLFREINMIKDRELNLHEFLLKFYPELKDLEKSKLYKECKIAFIFDGLDESRLLLNFKSETLNTVEERASVDVLFTSLVKGKLLPSALVWVTSRPAAANQIPPQYIGFTDQQKEEYFRKKITDENLASKIISHIKTSRSLFIMCHIPVFCWITATLNQENIVFYEEDLKACAIDVSKDTEFTGMIAEIFKMEDGLHETKVYCFVHLMHVFVCYLKKNMQELQFFFDKPEENITLKKLLQKAIDKAMKSKRGHLDLFLR
ncbi:hypothetical protein M9458_008805, partial [Cirrhinus mrigala]